MDSQYGCKISDLEKKKEPVNNTPQVSENIDVDVSQKDLSKKTNQKINNIKLFIILLLVYLIIHTKAFEGIIGTILFFTNTGDSMNIFGKIIMFVILATFYFVFSSSEVQKTLAFR